MWTFKILLLILSPLWPPQRTSLTPALESLYQQRTVQVLPASIQNQQSCQFSRIMAHSLHLRVRSPRCRRPNQCHIHPRWHHNTRRTHTSSVARQPNPWGTPKRAIRPSNPQNSHLDTHLSNCILFGNSCIPQQSHLGLCSLRQLAPLWLHHRYKPWIPKTRLPGLRLRKAAYNPPPAI